MPDRRFREKRNREKRAERRHIVRAIGSHRRWAMYTCDLAWLADDVIGFGIRCPRSLRKLVRIQREQHAKDIATWGAYECPF